MSSSSVTIALNQPFFHILFDRFCGLFPYRYIYMVVPHIHNFPHMRIFLRKGGDGVIAEGTKCYLNPTDHQKETQLNLPKLTFRWHPSHNLPKPNQMTPSLIWYNCSFWP